MSVSRLQPVPTCPAFRVSRPARRRKTDPTNAKSVSKLMIVLAGTTARAALPLDTRT
jgi:hypothetical protein